MVSDHKTLRKAKIIYVWMWSVQEIWADAVIDKITFNCKLIDSL